MRHSGRHRIDRILLLQKAYYLSCFFFANKEIARRSDPEYPADDPLSALEWRFFETEVSRALIELAVGLRVIDDQMRQLPPDDDERLHYERKRGMVDRYSYDIFEEEGAISFRELCNKIIHSNVLEPHVTDGSEPHEFDRAYLAGDQERSIDWAHYSGLVRLSGQRYGKEWYVLLNIETFINGVYHLMVGSGAIKARLRLIV